MSKLLTALVAAASIAGAAAVTANPANAQWGGDWHVGGDYYYPSYGYAPAVSAYGYRAVPAAPVYGYGTVPAAPYAIVAVPAVPTVPAYGYGYGATVAAPAYGYGYGAAVAAPAYGYGGRSRLWLRLCVRRLPAVPEFVFLRARLLRPTLVLAVAANYGRN